MTDSSAAAGAQTSGLYYPNRFARALLNAMGEVMGEHGLSATLELADLSALNDHYPEDNLAREFDFAALARLNAALDELYGSRGGRGMALRAGRAWFARGMTSFGALTGVSDPAFRALPPETRCRIVLGALAEIFSRFSDQRSWVDETETAFHFHAQPSPTAWDQQADRPICHLLVGLLQEAMRWASNGREYTVRETYCAAVGGLAANTACQFVINKQPISG